MEYVITPIYRSREVGKGKKKSNEIYVAGRRIVLRKADKDFVTVALFPGEEGIDQLKIAAVRRNHGTPIARKIEEGVRKARKLMQK